MEGWRTGVSSRLDRLEGFDSRPNELSTFDKAPDWSPPSNNEVLSPLTSEPSPVGLSPLGLSPLVKYASSAGSCNTGRLRGVACRGEPPPRSRAGGLFIVTERREWWGVLGAACRGRCIDAPRGRGAIGSRGGAAKGGQASEVPARRRGRICSL